MENGRQASAMERIILSAGIKTLFEVGEQIPLPPNYMLRCYSNAALVRLCMDASSEEDAIKVLDSIIQELRHNFAGMYEQVKASELAKK